MDRSLSGISSTDRQWGYWLAGLFCVLSILSVSFGVTPLLIAIRSKTITVELPGQTEVDLRLPGAYIAICVPKDFTADMLERLNDLRYSLVDEKGTESEIVKLPPRKYASDRPEAQVPLFQFIVEDAGKYVLTSAYPYDLEGPKVNAVLIYMDYKYVRTELIVGLAFFLVFGGLGTYFLVKTIKANRHSRMRTL